MLRLFHFVVLNAASIISMRYSDDQCCETCACVCVCVQNVCMCTPQAPVCVFVVLNLYNILGDPALVFVLRHPLQHRLLTLREVNNL